MRSRHRPPSGPLRESLDSEINVRAIGGFLVWLTIGMIVVLVSIAVLYRGLLQRERAADAPPSPLVDRTQRRLPPEPRLQATPVADLQAYLAEERRRVASYGWVDENSGVVHIPVDSAMQLLVARGLQAPTTAAVASRAAAPGAATPVAHQPGGHP